jgi:hypothetical protein
MSLMLLREYLTQVSQQWSNEEMITLTLPRSFLSFGFRGKVVLVVPTFLIDASDCTIIFLL